MNSETMSAVKRPDCGSLGRKYRMYANYFEMGTSKPIIVHLYHVDIGIQLQNRLNKVLTSLKKSTCCCCCVPLVNAAKRHPLCNENIKLNRAQRKSIFYNCLLNYSEQLGFVEQQVISRIGYDGSSICFCLDQPFIDEVSDLTCFEIETSITNHHKAKAHVSLKYIGPMRVNNPMVTHSEVSALTPVQVMDVLLRQCNSAFYPTLEKSLYTLQTINTMKNDNKNGAYSLIPAIQLTSVNSNENGDNAASCSKYSMVNFLCDTLNQNGGKRIKPAQLRTDFSLNDEQEKIFALKVKGLQIVVEHDKRDEAGVIRHFTVKQLDKSAAECTFTARDGTVHSVAKHFAEKYGQLKYPKLCTLKVVSSNRRSSHSVNIPIEHCFVLERRNIPLANSSVTKPIPVDVAKSLLSSNLGKERSSLKAVEGRVLPSPNVTFGNNQTVEPKSGAWDTPGFRFHLPAAAKGVAVVAFGHYPDAANEFIAKLFERCRQSGMSMPNVDQLCWHLEEDVSSKRVAVALKSVCTKMSAMNLQCDLILVFLNSKTPELYSEVKTIGEVQMGLMTQCIAQKTMERGRFGVVSNLALKLNTKLGGINFKVTHQQQHAKHFAPVSTLAIGIDISSPEPTNDECLKVISVVGSLDMKQMRYGPSVKVQKVQRNESADVAPLVVERLLAFEKSTQQKPNRLIIYRYGMAQKSVLKQEVLDIRTACRQMDAQYKPKVTYIVVPKRHNTRLFPADPNDTCGENGNVHPGTVVDSNIVNPDEFVFYLCSHASRQGTSHPTKYHVMHDDNNFSSDDLQMTTYYLCHCLSGCARSVSIPAPIVYADHVGARARVHLSGIRSEELPVCGLSNLELSAATTVDENLRQSMYFA